MTTQQLITSRDPKGLHAVGLFEAIYNKAKLTEEEAQRLNENGGELQAGIAELIKKLSVSNEYAGEESSSTYTYPKEYKGPQSILLQIAKISDLFGLSTVEAMMYAQNLPELPEGAEGWFAIPKVSSIVAKFFQSITDPAQQYCEAVKLVHEKIKSSRDFYNYRDGEIDTAHLRTHVRTIEALHKLEESQPGDILIIAAQLGMRHRAQSVRRARETFKSNEFGLTSFAVCCIALVHPERLVRNEELDMDCAGDEFSPDGDGAFSGSPCLRFDGKARFDASVVSLVSRNFGSASGFVPLS